MNRGESSRQQDNKVKAIKEEIVKYNKGKREYYHNMNDWSHKKNFQSTQQHDMNRGAIDVDHTYNLQELKSKYRSSIEDKFSKLSISTDQNDTEGHS